MRWDWTSPRHDQRVAVSWSGAELAAFTRVLDQARCLQHLGAAALTDPVAAGQLAHGTPDPLPRPAEEEITLAHLTRAKSLRAGQPDTTLVDHYLTQATH